MWFVNKYQFIFFDLDRTLWDFEANAYETLKELFDKYELYKFIGNPEEFTNAYAIHNNRLWAEYTKGNLRKEQLRKLRFYLTLKQFGIDDRDLGGQMDVDYLALCPQKTTLFPYTKEILDYLISKKYKLYILTNGFAGVQDLKLKNSGIDKYFDAVISSEKVGYQKPDARIFQYALSLAKVPAKKCIMVGDDWEGDILGAKNAGIDQIFFNPQKIEHKGKPTYEVALLKEIETIL